MSEDKLDACVAMLREKNPKAAIITTPWDELKGEQINEQEIIKRALGVNKDG